MYLVFDATKKIVGALIAHQMNQPLTVVRLENRPGEGATFVVTLRRES